MESELITQLISIAKIQYFITAPTIMEQRRTLLSFLVSNTQFPLWKTWMLISIFQNF